MKYQVIFKGKLNEDLSQTAILNNLMHLFQASEADINSRFFSGKESVIAENLSEEEADNYVALIRNAGAGVIKILQIEVNSTLPEYTPQYHKHDSLYGFQVNDTHQSDINNLYTVSETGERYIPSEVRPPKEKTFLRNDADMNACDILDELYADESKREVPLLSSERTGRLRFMLRLFVSLSIPALFYWLFYLCLYLKISHPDLLTSYGIDTFTGENYSSIQYSLLALLLIYLCCLCLFYIQRLHDFNRSAWWLAVLVLGTIVLAYGLNQIPIIQEFVHPLHNDQWQIVLDKFLQFKNKFDAIYTLPIQDSNFIETTKQALTQIPIDINTDKMNVFSFVLLIIGITTFIHLFLFIMPGSKTYNDFGGRPSQIKPKRCITFILSIILIASPFIFGEATIDTLIKKVESVPPKSSQLPDKNQKMIFVE